jgi:hypothetical protein
MAMESLDDALRIVVTGIDGPEELQSSLVEGSTSFAQVLQAAQSCIIRFCKLVLRFWRAAFEFKT